MSAERKRAVRSAQTITLFTGLDERAIRELRQEATEQVYPADQPIYRQGDPTIGSFVVLSGSVEVRRETTAGERLLYSLKKGETLGEADLASESKWRQCSAYSTETVTCLEFSQNPLEVFRQRPDPAVARRLLRNFICVMARRLREMGRAEGRAEATASNSHISFDEMNDTVAFLRRYLSPQFESEILSRRKIEPVTLDRGRLLYEVGAASDCFYLIRRGTVEITSRRRDGTEKRTLMSGPSILGEVSFFSNGTRSVKATAGTALSVLRFPGEQFRHLRRRDPEAALDLLLMTAELSCGLLQSRETMYG